MDKTRALILAALVALTAVIAAHPATDPLSQRSFPCEEDEVLGYAPRFGPDAVGCIHRETL